MTGNRWVKRDRRYRSGYRWTPYAYRAFWKWTFLIGAWIVLNIIVTVAHAGWLVLVTTGGLIWYAVLLASECSRVLRARTPAGIDQEIRRPAGHLPDPAHRHGRRHRLRARHRS